MNQTAARKVLAEAQYKTVSISQDASSIWQRDIMIPHVGVKGHIFVGVLQDTNQLNNSQSAKDSYYALEDTFHEEDRPLKKRKTKPAKENGHL
eukprot:10577064-Karenia_brevis.AAC.1